MPSRGNGVLRAARHKVPAEEEGKYPRRVGAGPKAATATATVMQGIMT